jgi:hypothetical protein
MLAGAARRPHSRCLFYSEQVVDTVRTVHVKEERITLSEPAPCCLPFRNELVMQVACV